ncbi:MULTISPECIES: hypothetical protein [unclassified Streptomyces]|uniref:hypothetical protein n=1 Tax=unclassified Streptomyces TaxID=2593676 RepID=UPI0033B7A904
MNQVGDKPEEVRKHLQEEKRDARQKERKPGDDRSAKTPGPVRRDDEPFEEPYEEPEDRP